MSFSRVTIFFKGYKEHVYHEGDQLVLIHSHELQSPVLLGRYLSKISKTFFT